MSGSSRKRRSTVRVPGYQPGAFAFALSCALALASFALSLPAEVEAATALSPATPPAPNADGRAYEMVTPPDKATRRGGGYFGSDDLNVNAGVPGRDGNSMLLPLSAGVLTDEAGGALGWELDRLKRTEDGWRPQPIFDRPVQGSAFSAGATFIGASADQAVTSTFSGYPTFEEQGTLSGGFFYTRFLDSSPSWLDAPGWGIWNGGGALSAATNGSALFTDGDLLVQAGRYRCLLGPTDPSCEQSGGTAVYGQDLASGARELLSQCTGKGLDATLIPARVGDGTVTDTIGAQPCEEGAVPSVRGAQLGAGGNGLGSPTNVALGGPAANAVSDDGSRVFFTSPDSTATGVRTTCAAGTGGATDCPPQLYVRQLDATGEPVVRWISRPQVAAGQRIAEIGAGAGFQGASDDGSVVYFRTNAPLVPSDPNGGQSITDGAASPSSWDLYRYDLPADRADDPSSGVLTRISGGPDGAADPNTGTQQGTLRYLSDDGSRAYFVTASPIPGAVNEPPVGSAPGAAPSGTPANSASRNLYLYDHAKSGAARWKFIAALPLATGTNLANCAASYPTPGGTLEVAGTPPVGEPRVMKNSCFFGAQVGDSSADVVTFLTAAQLTADDDDSAYDVYAYDSAADRLTRVSASQSDSPGGPYTCVASGSVQCNADLGFEPSGGGLTEAWRGLDGLRHLLVSERGDVFFQSRRSLTANDVNGRRMDVYRWRDGDLELVSPGDSADDSYLSGASVDGRDVFFQTSKPIDPREIDPGDFDIYDARVGGGFPYTPSPEECVGDDCQGPRSGEPSGDNPGSAGYEGPGNRGADRGKARRCERLERRRAKAERRAKRLTHRATRARRAARRDRRRATQASRNRAQRLRRQARARQRSAQVLRRRAGAARKQARSAKRKMGRCGAGSDR